MGEGPSGERYERNEMTRFSYKAEAGNSGLLTASNPIEKVVVMMARPPGWARLSLSSLGPSREAALTLQQRLCL